MIRFSILLCAIIFFSCKDTEKKEESYKNIITKEKKQEADNDVLSNIEYSILGNYSKPLANKFNSDLALSNTEGDKLFVYSENNNPTPKLIYNTQNIGNNFAWSKEGTHVIFKEKTKDYQTKIISLHTENLTREELKNLPKHTAIKALSISDTIYYLDDKTLAVKAKFKDTEWNISTEKGNYYNIEVSPDNKYIIAHKGSFIYLFTTSGTFIKKLGKGIATNWHPDSKHIIGFLDSSEDGHNITGSELFLFHVANDPVQITQTPNKIETWPSFKNDTEVIYRDEKRNGVFSTNIKQHLN